MITLRLPPFLAPVLAKLQLSKPWRDWVDSIHNAILALQDDVVYKSVAQIISAIKTFSDSVNITGLTGKGIKLYDPAGTPTEAFGWADMLGEVHIRGTGANRPVLATYRTTGPIEQYNWVANDRASFTYHIPHDYVPGSLLSVHVHWSIAGLPTSGAATWQAYVSYSKGHNQEAFTSTVTLTPMVQNVNTTTARWHHLCEIDMTSDGGSASTLDVNTIEVDGIIELTLVLSATTITGAVNNNPFVHYCDIHYQTTGLIGTLNRYPDFYLMP